MLRKCVDVDFLTLCDGLCPGHIPLLALPFSLQLFVQFIGSELWLVVLEGVLCTRSGLPLESLAVPDLRPPVKEETYWPGLCV